MIGSDLVYVQVFKNRMKWTNYSSDTELTFDAPFSSENLKLHNFDLAEEELKKSLRYSGLRGWFKGSPTLIMHQPGDENKLSPLELRALREVGYSAGARKVYVWQGHVLDQNDIRNKVYKNT